MFEGKITPTDQQAGTWSGVRTPLGTGGAAQRERYPCCPEGEGANARRLPARDVARVCGHLARIRCQRVQLLPLNYIPNAEFQRVTRAQEKILLGPSPASAKSRPRVQPPAGLPSYLTSLYGVPLLTREQEVHLFRKMNYLKYKASRLVARLDPEQPDNRLLDRIEDLYQQSVGVKNEIIRANLRLVVAMAKRYADRAEPLFELISDGNISLIRAVEKFDFARGFKFSTYATWAIIRTFAQTIPRSTVTAPGS